MRSVTKTLNIGGGGKVPASMAKSYKFGELSVRYKKVYYFPLSNIKYKDGKVLIQGVFNDGKWRQDTFKITEQLYQRLKSYAMG